MKKNDKKNGVPAFVFLVALLTGCTEPPPPAAPVSMTVLEARLAQSPQAADTVVALTFELHNRGREPVHVMFDSARVTTENGERSQWGPLRRQLRAESDAVAARLRLADLGLEREAETLVGEGMIEMAPGERRRKALPFRLESAPRQVRLELMYHDMATDAMLHLQGEASVH